METDGIEIININDIKGFKIGQAQNHEAATGCTVIICEKGSVCGVDVRGGSPGTRDTDALNPVNYREKTYSVLLSGGSSFGLDAAAGVMKFLEQRKIGRDMGVAVVPNVCAAILFDLNCGRHDIRPDERMGYAACENAFAGQCWESGNFGAGTGATVGNIYGNDRAMKGGIGSFAYSCKGVYAGAIVAVNCVGDVYEGREKIAGARSACGKHFADAEIAILNSFDDKDLFGGNTVIGCIITNASLTKPQAAKLASLGHNGIARAVRPAHTVFDGDTVFAMCTGEAQASLDAVGVLAVNAVEAAILDADKNAETYDKYIAAKDMRHG